MAFRSPGSRPSPRIQKQHVPDGPIQEFTRVIENTIPEDWHERSSALQRLVSEISSSIEHNNVDGGGVGHRQRDTWYTSPPTLRHLAVPLSELIKDARSTVVKRTCESLREIFTRCKSDARYLFKDLMPTICLVHASTVQVIRNYIQVMILASLPYVPCKMSMPIWLDRLKHDKSRTVREACSLYLSASMTEWGAPSDDDFDSSNNGYLSREIYLQVGTILVKSLRDPSPNVRQNCKLGLQVVSTQQDDVIEELANDSSLTRDVRVQKLLIRLQEGEDVGDDNISVASRMSRGGASIASAPVRRGGGYGGSSVSSYRRSRHNNYQHHRTPNSRFRNNNRAIPMSPSSNTPHRIPTTIGVASIDVASPPLPPSSSSSYLGPPRRVLNGTSSSTSRTTNTVTVPPSTPSPVSFLSPKQGYDLNNNSIIDASDLGNKSFDSNDTDTPLKPMANAEELRQVAKKRTEMNCRRSSLLHDRLIRSASKKLLSSSQTTNCEVADTTRDGINNSNKDNIATNIKSVTNAMNEFGLRDDPTVNGKYPSEDETPIHTRIAIELLEAHKQHVDDLMQILKVEMEMLRNFEEIVLEENLQKPTEEEVLEYFESVGLCLDQRKKAGKFVQKKMDRISQG